MDSVTGKWSRKALPWIAVIALWLSIYVCAIASVAASLMFFMVYQGSVSENPFESWYMPAAILFALLGVTVGLRAFWPRLVFTEENFLDAVRESCGYLSNIGRVRISGFGAVEVGYYFHRGFVSFPIDWKPPKFQPKRMWMEDKLKDNEGWLKAWHLWSVMKLSVPLVIRLPGELVDSAAVTRAQETIKGALDGGKVEVWLQRKRSDGVWVHHITSEARCEVDQADDIFLFAYAAPWDKRGIRAGVLAAAELGRQFPNCTLQGPGWFAG